MKPTIETGNVSQQPECLGEEETRHCKTCNQRLEGIHKVGTGDICSGCLPSSDYEVESDEEFQRAMDDAYSYGSPWPINEEPGEDMRIQSEEHERESKGCTYGDAAATSKCAGCGKPLCPTCGFKLGDDRLCNACFELDPR